MDVINRSAVVVKPGRLFLVWLHRVDPTSRRLTLEDLRQEPSIYLLPECDDQEQAFDYLREVSSDIFEEQLDSWYRVPSVWPRDRGLSALRKWFEISFHSMIIDLAAEPIEREEM